MAGERKAYKSLLIDKDSWKRLKLISVERELPMTHIIRELLDMYEQPPRPKKKAPAKSKSNAKASSGGKPKTKSKTTSRTKK